MVSLAPALRNLTLIFKPVPPLSITAPDGMVQTYLSAPETDVEVYVVPVGVPTIGQMAVSPVRDVGVLGAFVETVAITLVLDEEIQPVVGFFAVA